MPWLWGSSSRNNNSNEEDEEEEDDDDEYTDEEYTDDEDGEEEDEESYESDEESYTDEESEEVVVDAAVDEKKAALKGDAASNGAVAAPEVEKKTSAKNVSSVAVDDVQTKTPMETNKGNTKKVMNGKTAIIDTRVQSYAQEFDDTEEEDDDDLIGGVDEGKEAELERLEANIPDKVLGNRERAPSALTLGEDDDDDEEEELSHASNASLDESNHSETSNENEHVTTMAEKQSLLVLAAEHDRVDILNSVLSHEDGETKNALLHGGIPPLHIAILHGSTNTATCLLRLGADPSIRPNVKQIAQDQDPQAPLDVPKQIDGLSAWELAFDKKKSVVPKAKQQGLMNAFSAEALRCMGSDEGGRLQQLLDAGMPSDMAIMGDKSLYDWAVELGAPQCEEVLRPAQAAKYETSNGAPTTEVFIPTAAPSSGGKSAVLDRPSTEGSVGQLIRQLEELESLAKALSTCLDSLAEEVSVSHGLLLMGGGASALASHVRSLKTLKEQKMHELSRHQEAFENTQNELEYWISQAGPKGKAIAAQEAPASSERKQTPPPRFKSVEEEKEYRESLHNRIAATNDKIRKFRISIADLSEENNRNILEVEKRGLTGGINLVRGLKDEIREIEFSLEEIKAADSVYRVKIEMIQNLLNSGGDINGGAAVAVVGEENSIADTSKASTEAHFNHATNGNGNTSRAAPPVQASDSFYDVASEQSGAEANINIDDDDGEMKASERIATGHSTALTVRREGPGPGSFPLSLWQILLRIIGLRDGMTTTTSRGDAPRRQGSGSGGGGYGSASQPAMIV